MERYQILVCLHKQKGPDFYNNFAVFLGAIRLQKVKWTTSKQISASLSEDIDLPFGKQRRHYDITKHTFYVISTFRNNWYYL